MSKIDSRFVFLVLITIVYGFGVGFLIQKEAKSCDDLLSYVATIISIICVMFLFLRIKLRRYVYISLKKDSICLNILERLKAKFKSKILVTAYDQMEGGDLIDNLIKQKIAMCNFCVVLIDGELTTFQKKEIKEMKKQNKRIVPVLLSKDSVLPSALANISPIKYDEL